MLHVVIFMVNTIGHTNLGTLHKRKDNQMTQKRSSSHRTNKNLMENARLRLDIRLDCFELPSQNVSAVRAGGEERQN